MEVGIIGHFYEIFNHTSTCMSCATDVKMTACVELFKISPIFLAFVAHRDSISSFLYATDLFLLKLINDLVEK